MIGQIVLGIVWILGLVLLGLTILGLRDSAFSAIARLSDVVKQQGSDLCSLADRLDKELAEMMDKVNNVRSRMYVLEGEKANVKEFVELDKKVAEIDGRGTVMPVGWTPEVRGKLFKPGEESKG